jgi:hypothetical protein
MTSTTDSHLRVRAYREALPRRVYAQLHDTQRIAALVVKATERGWDVPSLVRETSRDLYGVSNAGGVITHRLEHCAEHDPPERPSVARPEWCGQCDRETRHVRDEYGYASPARCPTCHPLNHRRADAS